MARRVKVAFQGGGAKFVPLLAAAQAFQCAENDDKIEVTAVSGTSAGAIVACLYSARIDLKGVHRHLSDNPRPYLSLVSALTDGGLSRLSAASKIWMGTPLISELNAKIAYDRLLNAVGVRPPFPQLKIPTRVIAANLVTRSSVIYDSTEAHEPEQLLNAILWDSCGLPFVFKSHKMGNGLIVDGGICENLPADCLTDIKDKEGALIEGEIVGVSFKDTRLQVAPNTAFQFALALLDTAIENSMRRAKRVLSDRIIAIDTTIGTFDFKKALSEEGLGSSYKLIMSDVLKELENILKTPRGSSLVIRKDNRVGSNTELQRRMNRIYETQFARYQGYTVKFQSMIVIANSLRSEDYSGPREDVVLTMVDLAPCGSPLQCYMMGLGTSGEFIEGDVEGGATWKLTAPDGEEREVTVMPMIDEDLKTVNTSSVLVWFTPPLEPIVEENGGSYRLLQRDYLRGALDKLKDQSVKKEQLGFTWLRPVKAERAEIVAFVPDTPEMRSIILEDFDFEEGRVHVTGRAMNRPEINKYLSYGLAPEGMHPVGWVREEGLREGEQIGVQLVIR
jgi:predicted acylesterase/phospholipase RssA